jgi:hypothetical protein
MKRSIYFTSLIFISLFSCTLFYPKDKKGVQIDTKKISSVILCNNIYFLQDTMTIRITKPAPSMPLGGVLGVVATTAVEMQAEQISTQAIDELNKALCRKTKTIISSTIYEAVSQKLEEDSYVQVKQKSSTEDSLYLVLLVHSFGYKSLITKLVPFFIVEARIISLKKDPRTNAQTKYATYNMDTLSISEGNILWSYTAHLNKDLKKIKNTGSLLELNRDPALLEECLYETSAILAEKIRRSMHGQ